MNGLRLSIELPLDRFCMRVELDMRHHVTGVFGASGSGKTSLLETIAGLRTGATGTIGFGEKVWLDSARRVWLSPERRGVGYVPQDALLFPHLDVRRNLLFGARRKVTGASFDSVVGLLELAPLLRRDVTTLSGGERQRVALGRALCSGPGLLLLDEPLASLDLGLRAKVLPFLCRVKRELELPMLLVSHDPREIQALCDEVVVISQGEVTARGEPSHVLVDPSTRFAGQGFENVLGCRVAGPERDVTRLGLGPQVELLVPHQQIPAGQEAIVVIPAGDILLATERPGRISARNLLEAVVVSLTRLDSTTLVRARLVSQGPELVAELTHGACSELGLKMGLPVVLIIKSSSCRVMG